MRSRAVVAAWRNGAAYRKVAAAFDQVSADDAEGLASAATALFADVAWLEALFDPLIAALRADPWFEPPFKVNRDERRSGAILFQRPGVAVILTALERRVAGMADPDPPAASIICSGRLAVTRYLRAGGATLARWAADPLPDPLIAAAIAPCRRLPDHVLSDGDIVRHDGRIGAESIASGHDGMLTLSAAISAGADPVARAYDRRTGRFLRLATNDDGAARSQLLLSLLRASNRPDPDAFDGATRDAAFFLRWSAMRDWLASDWRAALPRLHDMAQADPHPEVRAAATAVVDRLTLRAA